MVTSTVCHPHKTIKGQTLDWLKHLFQCPWRQGLFFFLPAKRCLTEHLLSIQFIWTFSYITILRTRASFRSFSKEWHRQNKCLLPSSHACVPFALFLSLQVASARMCVCVFCCLALIFQQNKLIRALPATLPPFFFFFDRGCSEEKNDEANPKFNCLCSVLEGTRCTVQTIKLPNSLQTLLQSPSIKTLCLAYKNKTRHWAEYQISPPGHLLLSNQKGFKAAIPDNKGKRSGSFTGYYSWSYSVFHGSNQRC